MSDDWQDQITDFFDGSLTEVEALRLNEWIKSDPRNVRRFVRQAIIHSHLHDLLNGEEAMHQQQADERMTLTSGETMVLPALRAQDEPGEPDEIEGVFPPTPVVTPLPQPIPVHRRRWFRAASIMIPLLVGLVIYWLAPRTHSVVTVAPEPRQLASTEPVLVAPPLSFATIESTVDAQWSGGTGQFQSGQPLPATTLFLQSGFAEIKFDTGAAMIVEAPARFQVRAANSVELTSGQISAKVPVAAHGFAVETTTTRIVDFGTEFGVAISPDGSDLIQVFKGNVQAQPQARGPVAPLMLKEGQAAVSTGHEIKLDPAGAQPQKFVRQLDSELAALDLVDLITGGDGTTHRRGIAVDYQKHAMGIFDPAGTVDGDHQYHRVSGSLVVDGCFIPDGSNGPVEVNSIGQTHVFPSTENRVYDQIWTGGRIPGLATEGPIPTGLGGVDYSTADHSILFMSSNGGLTIDLAAIRRLHPAYLLKRLQCTVGNGDSSTKVRLADIYVLLGDKVAFEQRKFPNRHAPFTVDVPLDPADRFVTFVVTDGGDAIPHDGILWADPKLIGEAR